MKSENYYCKIIKPSSITALRLARFGFDSRMEFNSHYIYQPKKLVLGDFDLTLEGQYVFNGNKLYFTEKADDLARWDKAVKNKQFKVQEVQSIKAVDLISIIALCRQEQDIVKKIQGMIEKEVNLYSTL